MSRSRIVRLRERESDRQEAGGAGGDEDRLGGRVRGVLGESDPRGDSRIRAGHRGPHPDEEDERGHVRGTERSDGPRRPEPQHDRRHRDPTGAADGNAFGGQPGVVGRRAAQTGSVHTSAEPSRTTVPS